MTLKLSDFVALLVFIPCLFAQNVYVTLDDSDCSSIMVAQKTLNELSGDDITSCQEIAASKFKKI